MKSLFDHSDMSGILARMEKLSPHSQRHWGRMSVDQMLAHCNLSLETAMGLNSPKKLPLIGRVIGSLVKPGFFSDKPFPKNSRTDDSYVVTEDRDFAAEKAKALRLVQAFCAGGPKNCTAQKHVFFGMLTPQDWAFMQWKHFNHHLIQFGV